MSFTLHRKIALYGRSGSGKGTVARILAHEFGYAHVSSGSICRKISRILYGDEDRSHLNSISIALRSIDYHVLIMSALRETNTDLPHVFDSIRYESDYLWFKKNGYALWKIDCPREVCIERLIERGQIFSAADLQHSSESELDSHGFHHIIENVDTTIENLARHISNQLSLGR